MFRAALMSHFFFLHLKTLRSHVDASQDNFILQQIHTFLSIVVFELLYFIQKRGSTLAYVKREDPDVFCIQETKCQEDAIPKVLINHFGSLKLKHELLFLLYVSLY